MPEGTSESAVNTIAKGFTAEYLYIKILTARTDTVMRTGSQTALNTAVVFKNFAIFLRIFTSTVSFALEISLGEDNSSASSDIV